MGAYTRTDMGAGTGAGMGMWTKTERRVEGRYKTETTSKPITME